MRKILVTNLNYGQLGNRLFYNAHLIAYALEYDVRLVITNLYKYLKYFMPEMNNNILLIRSSLLSILSLMVSKPVSFLLNIKNTQSENSLIKYISKKSAPIILINHWNLYANHLVKKHKKSILAILNFKKEYKEKAASLMDNIRRGEKNKIIIGVHIRGGDYKNWYNGKYYYSVSQYTNLMKQLSSLFDNMVEYICCSDEEINISDFGDLRNQITISHNDAVVDLLILSMCDYILGPPSTFNAWASFIGDTPLYTIKDIDKSPSFTDFKVNYGDIASLTNN